MTEDLTIYWHGVAAFCAGSARDDNPYEDCMSFDRVDWANGWDDASNGKAKAQEALWNAIGDVGEPDRARSAPGDAALSALHVRCHLAPRIRFRLDAALERGDENITIGVPLARELVAALDGGAAFDSGIPEVDEQAAMERLERYVRAMADADDEDMMEWEREYGRRARAAMKIADAEIAGALARSAASGGKADFVVVPAKPTPEMRAEGERTRALGGAAHTIYRSMITTKPYAYSMPNHLVVLATSRELASVEPFKAAAATWVMGLIALGYDEDATLHDPEDKDWLDEPIICDD